MLRFAVPAIFVLIWPTGFIVAKAVKPHADLQLYLVARFALTALAVQAYILFSETLSPVQFTGFALALAGVLLARSARTSQ